MAKAYSFGVDLNQPYGQTVDLVKQALKNEGFGVLTEIDVRATLLEKLGVELEPYVILGACMPQAAHQALQRDPLIGVLLPCNVTVRATGADTSRVDIMDPDIMVEVTGDDGLQSLATQVGQRLRRAVSALQNQPTKA